MVLVCLRLTLLANMHPRAKPSKAPKNVAVSMTPGDECPLSGAKWAKRRAMYAIDPVQKASRRYMVTSVQILSATLV